MQYVIYADGSCENNGRQDASMEGSFAAFELADEDTVVHEDLLGRVPIVHESRRRLLPFEGGQPTNNMAEALSLHMAVAFACTRKLLAPGNRVLLFMDSELILKQFTGLYKTKNSLLRKIYRSIYDMLARHSQGIGDNALKYLKVDWVSGDIMKRSVIGH